MKRAKLWCGLLLTSVGLIGLASTGCDPAAKPAGEKGEKGEKGETGEKGEKGEKDETAEAAHADRDHEVGPAIHFDVSQDHAGVLARAASALEATESIPDDSPVHQHLMAVSHHAESGPSNEELCTHVLGLDGTPPDPEKDQTEITQCGDHLEHQRVQLGPEVFSQFSKCLMNAHEPKDFDACESAEAEAEKELHEKAHGEKLSEADCNGFVDHFAKLAVDDAKDDAEKEIVGHIMETVKVDIVLVCQEEGMKAEVECAMKAKTMEEVGKCEAESNFG